MKTQPRINPDISGEISGFHGDEYKDAFVLGCCAL
jgi:hypothetical protein